MLIPNTDSVMNIEKHAVQGSMVIALIEYKTPYYSVS